MHPDVEPSAAFELYSSKQYEAAMPGLLRLEQDGSLEAKFCLAYMFKEGLGAPRDTEAALQRYQALREARVPLAGFYAGHMLQSAGRIAEALNFFKWAASHGQVSSMYALYRLGKDGHLDKEQTRDYFQAALLGGHFFAERDLIRRSMQGENGFIGRLTSVPKALKWVVLVAGTAKADPHDPRLF